MPSYEQQLLEIRNKIFQVLRIKKQLEARRLSYLNALSSTNDPKQVMAYLSSLENTYQKEERVYSICEKGLVNALIILGEAEKSVILTQSLRERIKTKFLVQIPIFGRKYKEGAEPLISFLNMMYNNLKEQIMAQYKRFAL